MQDTNDYFEIHQNRLAQLDRLILKEEGFLAEATTDEAIAQHTRIIAEYRTNWATVYQALRALPAG